MKLTIRFPWIAAALMLLVFFAGCSQKTAEPWVAVSYIYGEESDNSYLRWLKSVNPDAEYFVMYGMEADSMESVFGKCSGLLLTGGRDVYPGRYGQEEDTARCGSFDLYRDSLELALIEKALNRKMPVMGVCRGQQILNVALGGTLYVDIPTDLNTTVSHRCADWQNCYHRVRVFPDNLLSDISGLEEGTVNSNHHQAVDRLAENLRVLAVADDGVIESIGWLNTLNNGFMLGVQWHPERMDSTSRLSLPLAKKFLNEIEQYHRLN